MNETELLHEIQELCNARRLMSLHLVHGWAASTPGWPDLYVASRNGRRGLFREIKVRGRGLRRAQVIWRRGLIDGGEDYAVWQERDLKSGRIERELNQLTDLDRKEAA